MIDITNIPLLKTVRKRYPLPKGVPSGKGNIAYLITNNRNESYKIIHDNSNMLSMNRYNWYYYNYIYKGKINNRKYAINLMRQRKELKVEVMNQGLKYINTNDLSTIGVNFNLYFDTSKYIEIFNKLSINIKNPYKKTEAFWNYFASIILSKSTSNWDNKFVIIDAVNYSKINNKIKENLDNPIFLLYYALYRDYTILSKVDITFYIYHGSFVLAINPSKADKSTYKVFLLELKKLYRSFSIVIKDELEPENIQKEEYKEAIKERIKTSLNFTGDKEDNRDDIENKLEDDKTNTNSEDDKEEYNEEIDNDNTKNDEDTKEDNIEEFIDKKIEDKIDKDDPIIDDNFIKEVYAKTTVNTVRKSAASTARDALLRKQQGQIKLGDVTIDELKKVVASKIDIPKNEIGDAIKSTNKNLKEAKYQNINKTYLDKVYNKDIADSILSLNNKSMPIMVRNIKIEDTSDELNYIDTYTIELEDANRQRSTFKVDIPKFIDNKFMYLGGNKKLILNQNFLLPLVKTDSDTVQIVTNYNKMFVRRNDAKSLSSVELLMKIISNNSKLSNYFMFGRVLSSNEKYITNIEYDELSKTIHKFKYKDTIINFDQIECNELANSKNIKIKDGYMFIGLKGNNPILINHNTQRDDNNKGIVDIIMETIGGEVLEEYLTTKTPKRLMYAKVKSMEKDIPCIALCGFWEGFSTVFKKMNLKYRLSDKYPKDLSTGEDVIRFKDCYLIYDNNAYNALMMNGIKIFKTENNNLSDFDTKEPYMDILVKIYGKMNIAAALDNTYEFTIDPITLEVLRDLSLPTDIVSLMIYAVRLLADNQYTPDINQNLSRVRSIETIPAILYDSIAKNYITYKNSNGRKKFTIPRDTVITKLLKSPNVEDYSTLNPVLELERAHTISYKGWRGINLDDAYTIAKRTYDPTMVGIIGPTTSPDGGVGVAKVLSAEPMITSVRGYTKKTNKDELDKLNDVNLFSPGELLLPMAVTKDDPTRMGHAIKQSKHVVPVKNASPVLISNGYDEFCRFDLSTDFIVNAKSNGKVLEIHDKEKIMIIEYKDGTKQAINLAPVIVKNGGGGFYESMSLITELKPGDSFKKNDPLAWNKDFFSNDKLTGCRFSVGVLTKVALMSTYNTLDDSTTVTNKLAHDASTEMTFLKSINIGKNANISKMVKVGDHIEVGDSLAEFDTSFDDKALNEFLAVLGKDESLKNAVDEGSRNIVKASHAGIIEDIKIFCTVDLEELSPSLREIVQSYYKKIDARKKILDKYDKNKSIVKCGMMLNDPSGKVNPSKYGVIRGEKVNDSVLIEIYIKHEEYLEVGSKLANFSGLKNTIGEIIPVGYEPYSEFRPDEEVSTMIASNSILKRMVPSLILTILGNKIIIELKRKLKDMYYSDKFNSSLRKNMENTVYTFFNYLDKSGSNTDKYKKVLSAMSDNVANTWWKNFFNDDKAYFILDVVDYERTISIEDVEKAAKFINVPLFEYVATPHLTMDKNNVVWTQEPVPVGYVHIKRTQQTVLKKTGMSISADKRSALVGQVTGSDKNGRETDLENILLLGAGYDAILKELNGPRADDITMQSEMLHDIATNGFVRYSDLTNDVRNKTTLNTVNAFLLGMGLKSDLVSKGLMLLRTVDTKG